MTFSKKEGNFDRRKKGEKVPEGLKTEGQKEQENVLTEGATCVCCAPMKSGVG